MKNTYFDRTHRFGRVGVVIGLAFMLGIPAVISAVYRVWPQSLGTVFAVGGGLLAVFLPANISEVLSYTPILGSSAYITFLTGNVMNLKLPCAINAMALTETSQGTEEGDTVASLAVAASSVITTVIIAVGVLLLVPLQPILTLPAVQTATTYMLPALFGSLFLGMFDNKCGSEYVAKGKLKCVILPMALVLAANCFMSTAGMEGILMLIAMPLIVLSAWVLYKTGQIKMIPVKQAEPASPAKEQV